MGSVTVSFASAVSWGWLELALGLAAFIALRKHLDILWVVLGGCVFSILFL